MNTTRCAANAVRSAMVRLADRVELSTGGAFVRCVRDADRSLAEATGGLWRAAR